MKEYFGRPIKKLGFGLMRLPRQGNNESAPIDIGRLCEMVDLYLERGFTYFDTAYVYHSGNSEVAFKEAVSKRYPRDAFQITSKLPLWGPVNMEKMRAITDESLARAGLDFFDLYFLHGVGPDRMPMLDEIGAWDYLQMLKAEGKAQNVGFSYHGDAAGLERVLSARKPGEIDIVQLQINYLDWESPTIQSRLCYETARAHDVGIIVMEPVKGGSLSNFTPEVAEIFKSVSSDASLASWAMRFTLGLEGVLNVLSGMSNMEQLIDNMDTTDNFVPLSAQDLKLLEAAKAAIEALDTIPCTNCGYCLDDCPEHINTPRIIGVLNEYEKYRNLRSSSRQYEFATGGWPAGASSGASKSSDCTACGTCEDHCPQDIAIIEAHKKAAALFEQEHVDD